jgi:choline dehydrogenase-like flavoprotein
MNETIPAAAEVRAPSEKPAKKAAKVKAASVERPYGPSEWAAAMALAEAMIPGGRTVARADERTLEDSVALLEHTFPQLSKVWGKSALFFDHLAILGSGKRFRDLDHAGQEAMLRRWEESPALRGPLTAFMMAVKMTHFDRREVYEGMGGKLNVVPSLEPARWLSQVIDAGTYEGDRDVECDVVVVGTGAGGAVVGRELADKGHAVVFVEEGRLVRRDEFTGSSTKAHQEFYRGGISTGNNLFPVFMGRLVGGSTAVNGGTSFRTPRWVMDRWCEENRSDDFTAERMEPYFRKVESILQVEPAKRQFVGKIADVFDRGCSALGWSHFAIPRNAPGCEGTGFCDFGCRTDARRSTNISYIPPALEKGALLFTKLRAERVLIEGGRAVGVEGIGPDGRTIRVRGKAVIMAGGALPTPFFLMRQGLCGSSGQLGKNLTLHPSGGISAIFDEEIRGWESIPQGYGSDEFVKDGILLTAAQPDLNYASIMFPFAGDRLMAMMDGLAHIASFAVLIADDAKGRVLVDYDGSAAVHYRLTPRDVARYHQGLIKMAEICWAAGAKRVMPAIFGWPTIDSRAQFERFKKAKLTATELLLTSYHPLGTCKMGPDPRTSVVDSNHQAHDLPGLFIVDGSTVSGPLGVNPQLTIMALATRAAEKIDRLLDGSA